MTRQIVLASSSPRRQDLLRSVGLSFEVCVQPVDEHLSGSPGEVVSTLAERKARAVAARHPDKLIIGADTLVYAKGQTLGKPIDAQDALRMLRLLSDSWHSVYSGLCVYDAARDVALVRHVETRVRMARLSEQMMLDYIATGEPMDKAGAYALQGIAGLFVSEIQGSPSNVIGLPLQTLRELLDLAGCQILG